MRFAPDTTQQFCASCTLEIRTTGEDFQSYLAGQVVRLPRSVSQDGTLQEEIRREVIKAVDGMRVTYTIGCYAKQNGGSHE